MLVFSSGLIMFSSRSNRPKAALDVSTLAFNSSICFSMNAARPAEERYRILNVCST